MEDQFQKLRTWRTMEGQDNKLSLKKKNRKGGNSAMYCEQTAGLRRKIQAVY